MSRETDVEGETLLAEFRPARAVAARWVVVSTTGFFAFAYLFGAVVAAVEGRPLEPIVVSASSRPDLLPLVATLLALVALVVVPHELLHGLFMARYGGRPEYGVGVSGFLLPYAYARTEGTTYARDEMLAVLLAPFVVITLAGLALLPVLPVQPIALALAANAAGSIGDLWMAAVLLRYPSSVRVGERPDGADGMGIYGPADAAGSAFDSPRLAAFSLGAVYALAAVVAGLFALVFASLAFATGDVVLGDPDGRWFLFRHELHRGNREAVVEVGVPAVLALSAAGGLARVAFSAVRDRLGGEP
ncbi:DUF3267 domain-containing protein [Salinilacihabitans rarus]|uniref:DUF3267 domain-containing protein n=1 Tax=Salinilacihabitans rarus TaxID=2961596 RepID=UPI0020C9047F|nr:DUF3267 domain-containing protein [Salinilacihabitans rarus]